MLRKHHPSYNFALPGLGDRSARTPEDRIVIDLPLAAPPHLSGILVPASSPFSRQPPTVRSQGRVDVAAAPSPESALPSGGVSDQLRF